MIYIYIFNVKIKLKIKIGYERNKNDCCNTTRHKHYRVSRGFSTACSPIKMKRKFHSHLINGNHNTNIQKKYQQIINLSWDENRNCYGRTREATLYFTRRRSKQLTLFRGNYLLRGNSKMFFHSRLSKNFIEMWLFVYLTWVLMTVKWQLITSQIVNLALKKF